MYDSKKDDMTKTRLLTKLLLTFFITLFIMTVLLVAVQFIPTTNAVLNAQETAVGFVKEGDYPSFFFNNATYSTLDNPNDLLMISVAINTGAFHPLKTAMSAEHYCQSVATDYSGEEFLKIMNERINDKVTNFTVGGNARYWHGHQIYLKPLLHFFNGMQIRYINMLAFSILFFCVLFAIKDVLKDKYSFAFLLSMLFSMIYLVPMSRQSSVTFYIAFFLILVILNNRHKNFDFFICSFLVTGMLTCYFDILTTPIVSLGLPLTIYVLLKRNENTKNFKPIINLFVLVLSWLFGYVAGWVSKWVIASVILRKNILEEAMCQITFWLNTDPDRWSNIRYYSFVFEENLGLKSIKGNLYTFFNGYSSEVIMPFMLVLTALVIIAFLFKSKKESLWITGLSMFFISILPFIWYFFMPKHSICHTLFAFRNISVSVFAAFAFLLTCIDEKQIYAYKKLIIKKLKKC